MNFPVQTSFSDSLRPDIQLEVEMAPQGNLKFSAVQIITPRCPDGQKQRRVKASATVTPDTARNMTDFLLKPNVTSVFGAVEEGHHITIDSNHKGNHTEIEISEAYAGDGHTPSEQVLLSQGNWLGLVNTIKRLLMKAQFLPPTDEMNRSIFLNGYGERDVFKPATCPFNCPFCKAQIDKGNYQFCSRCTDCGKYWEKENLSKDGERDSTKGREPTHLDFECKACNTFFNIPFRSGESLSDLTVRAKRIHSYDAGCPFGHSDNLALRF